LIDISTSDLFEQVLQQCKCAGVMALLQLLLDCSVTSRLPLKQHEQMSLFLHYQTTN